MTQFPCVIMLRGLDCILALVCYSNRVESMGFSVFRSWYRYPVHRSGKLTNDSHPTAQCHLTIQPMGIAG